MPQYRVSIDRQSKKKKPPGKKGKGKGKHLVDTPSNIEENQATTTITDDSTEDADDIFNSTCAKKLKLDNLKDKEKPSTTSKEELDWCYLLFDTRVLCNIIDTIGGCPICSAKLYFFHEDFSEKLFF